jgi:beta-lactamase class A
MKQLVLFLLLSSSLPAAQLDLAGITNEIEAVAKQFKGRIGACVHPGDKFPMQSVVKLIVGFAVLDAVDTKGWKLDTKVPIQRKDLSLYVQPLEKLVGPKGYTTTIGDLVRRAVIDSDSAATDILIARLGGPAAVQAVLQKKSIEGIRVDRDERHLQTEIVGLAWRPEFVEPPVLDKAIAAVPEAKRSASFAAYQVDPRDTATPHGMAQFVYLLSSGDLLTPASTKFLMQAMAECKTFPNRLKAGVPAGWSIAHKTGTSGTWKSVTAATNDVGVITAPDGLSMTISVFVADSQESDAARDALIARIASIAVAHYH